MTPCLSPDELIDVADGVLPADRMAHVASCRSCRERARELTTTLAEIAGVEVPEPSPDFWLTLNRRVRVAIAEDQPAALGWRAWFGRRAVVPVAGIALVLATIAVGLDRRPTARPPAPVAQAPAAAPLDAAAVAADDDALALVMALAGTLPPADGNAEADALALAPLPDLGDVAAVTLTSDELEALEALLREAVDRPES